MKQASPQQASLQMAFTPAAIIAKPWREDDKRAAPRDEQALNEQMPQIQSQLISLTQMPQFDDQQEFMIDARICAMMQNMNSICAPFVRQQFQRQANAMLGRVRPLESAAKAKKLEKKRQLQLQPKPKNHSPHALHLLEIALGSPAN